MKIKLTKSLLAIIALFGISSLHINAADQPQAQQGWLASILAAASSAASSASAQGQRVGSAIQGALPGMPDINIRETANAVIAQMDAFFQAAKGMGDASQQALINSLQTQWEFMKRNQSTLLQIVGAIIVVVGSYMAYQYRDVLASKIPEMPSIPGFGTKQPAPTPAPAVTRRPAPAKKPTPTRRTTTTGRRVPARRSLGIKI